MKNALIFLVFVMANSFHGCAKTALSNFAKSGGWIDSVGYLIPFLALLFIALVYITKSYNQQKS